MKVWLFFLLFLYQFPMLIFADECREFFPDSTKVIDNYPAFAVAKDRFVSLKCPDNKEIVAYDRFKGLCLFKDSVKKPFYLAKHKVKLHFCQSGKSKTATILSYPSSIYPGRIKESIKKKGALFGECCHIAGIVKLNGEWFDVTSIKRLLRKDTKHSDIGVRFSLEGENVIIRGVNPFLNLPLLPGDIVKKIKKIKHPTLKEVRDTIDNCKVGREIFIQIARGKKTFKYNIRCFKRVGGGKISDTFLENFGVWFDKRLVISDIDKKGIGYKNGLRKGDRLLKIDKKIVSTQMDVQNVMSSYATKKNLPKNMLWERKGFQFFLLPTSI